MISSTVETEDALVSKRSPIFNLEELRTRAYRVLAVAANWLDNHTAPCVAVLLFAYLPLALLMAHTEQLSSDELYTFWIAQQPSLHKVLAMSREIDLHPPMHFLAERWALHLALPRWLGARLPSLVAGQLTLLVVFLLGRRHFGNLVGLVGAAMLWFSPALDFSWSNRPYALWLLFLSTTVFCWDAATGDEGRPWWMPGLLLLSGAAMVSDYMFGLACLLPFFIAEVFRFYRRRRVDWPVLVALIAPSVIGLAYLEQIQSFATNTFSPRYLPSIDLGETMYLELLTIAGAALAACWAVAALLVWKRPMRSVQDREPGRVRVEQWAMLVSLALLPALLMEIAFLHRTQFFTRYGACGTVGIAALGMFLVARYARWTRGVGMLMTLALVIASVMRANNDPPPSVKNIEIGRGNHAFGVPGVSLASLEPLPIVVGAATDFTELNDRLPLDLAHRLFYVTDRRAAQRYSGQTLFETEENTAALLHLPGHAEALQPFLAEHPRFYVAAEYMSSEQWILRYLVDHGARVDYQGKFRSTVGTEDLYLISEATGARRDEDGPADSR